VLLEQLHFVAGKCADEVSTLKLQLLGQDGGSQASG
jgi:hypothetical protein